jgi:hypothetical protein
VVHDAIDGGHGGHRIFEDPIPVGKDQIGRDGHAASFIALGTKLSIMPGSLIVTRNGNWRRRGRWELDSRGINQPAQSQAEIAASELVQIAHIRRTQHERVRQEWFSGLILRFAPGAWSRSATWHHNPPRLITKANHTLVRPELRRNRHCQS